MNSNLFFSIIILLLIAGFAYFVFKNKLKNFDLKESLINNTANVMKVIQTFSTASEVIILSMIAIGSGRMTLIDSIARYSLMGVIEVVTTLLFIIVFEHSINHAKKDGYISVLEAIIVIIKTVPVFFVALYFTGTINTAYEESINIVELQKMTPTTWLERNIPYFSTYIETDPNGFTDSMYDPETGELYPQGRYEWSALFSIYVTPFLNIFLVVLTLFQTFRKNKKGLGWKKALFALNKENPKDDSKKEENEKNESSINTNNNIKVHSISDVLIDNLNINEKWFGIKEKDFEKNLFRYCGLNFNTKENIRETDKTHKDVLGGSKNPVDVLEDVQKFVIGNGLGSNKSGLKGINAYGNYISELKNKINFDKESYLKIKKKLNGISNKSSNESLKLSSELKSKLKSINDKITPLVSSNSNRRSLIEEQLNRFSSWGFEQIDYNYDDQEFVNNENYIEEINKFYTKESSFN